MNPAYRTSIWSLFLALILVPSLSFAQTLDKGSARTSARADAPSPSTFDYGGLLFNQTPGTVILDNKGTDFIMGFLPNYNDQSTLEVHLTADAGTEVTVQYPVNAPVFNQTVSVTPGTITIVEIPVDASSNWSLNQATPFNNAVRAFSDNEFVVYMTNRVRFTSDAALALPVDVLNTDYLVQTYIPLSGGVFFGAEFVVVAAFDDTDVTVTPTAALKSGEPAGAPISFSLDRGEGWFAISAADLSGSSVEASKPVTITNGNRCTNVPPGTGFCDHVFEVAQPLASWGNRSLVPPLPNRTEGSLYRILAAEDGTTIFQNGAAVATVNAGEFHDTGIIPGAHVFASDAEDKPIFVTQFMTGSARPGTGGVGDPAMGNMVPSEQYLSAYTFSTVGGGQFAQNFLSVIAENDDVNGGTILLDGITLPSGEFTAISGTDFSYAVVAISEGTHTTQSAGVHGITVEGYNRDDSYIYPGGARFQIIFQGDDETPPVCSGSLDGDTFVGSATDLLSADPENTGVFFVALSEDSENLTIDVDAFVPGDESISYTVMRVDMGTDGDGDVVVTDGAGNTCSTPIFIPGSGNDDVDEDGVPNGEDNCPTTPNPDQSDSDGDGVGDVCDNCPDVDNPDQADTDGDGTGDVCEDDTEDRTPPVCGDITYEEEGPDGAISAILSSATDEESGIASVSFTSLVNLGGFANGNGPFDQGDLYMTPNPNPTTVALRGERIEYGVSARIVVEVTNGEGLTSFCDPVLSQLDASIPDAFRLEAVYPNPFRPSSGTARLGVRLAEAAPVRVVVYDALGREVARLVDEALDAGTYEVEWDGTDLSGRRLASGVYLYRVTAGAFVETQRITIVN